MLAAGWNRLHVAAIYHHPQGDFNTKEYKLTVQQFLHVHVENIKATVKIIVASTVITHPGLKLVEKPICALCAVLWRPEDGDLLLKHVGG